MEYYEISLSFDYLSLSLSLSIFLSIYTSLSLSLSLSSSVFLSNYPYLPHSQLLSLCFSLNSHSHMLSYPTWAMLSNCLATIRGASWFKSTSSYKESGKIVRQRKTKQDKSRKTSKDKRRQNRIRYDKKKKGGRKGK